MIKKIISKAILTLAFMGCIGEGFVTNAHAGNSYLDVTASNVSGVVSKDPYSTRTQKSDNEQNFYIKLTSLQYGPSISFTSYNSLHAKVSNALFYPSSKVGTTLRHSYDIGYAVKGNYYYVYASAPQYYGGVHGIGTYCP